MEYIAKNGVMAEAAEQARHVVTYGRWVQCLKITVKVIK